MKKTQAHISNACTMLWAPRGGGEWAGRWAGLTTLEPCLVQARVSGGFPVQEQVKAASIPMSTTMGLGSDSSLGPTVGRNGEAQPISTHPL